MTGEPPFGLRWPGREEAAAEADSPAEGSLRDAPGLGLRPAEAADRLVVGENLAALKLLAPEITGQVRLIYIDPPYNTGHAFLYCDRFRLSGAEWQALAGQREDRAGGRRHSPWLSLMLPRLLLARRLLHPAEGALFVSVDDGELAPLRLLLDEIFGAEHFVACITWHKAYAPKSGARHFSQDHEYILAYARDAARWRPRLLPRSASQDRRYRNPDADPRGPWRPNNLAARNPYSKGVYPIRCPSGRVIPGPPDGSYWRISAERLAELDADGRIWWGARGDNVPAPKIYLSEVQPGRVPQTLWPHAEVGHTQEAQRELQARVRFTSPRAAFQTAKPTRLLRRILQIATDPQGGHLALDFFAGSGTLGEAVWLQNAADGGDRRFILVQEPAPTGDAGVPTIAELARRRLLHAAGEIGGVRGLRVQIADRGEGR